MRFGLKMSLFFTESRTLKKTQNTQAINIEYIYTLIITTIKIRSSEERPLTLNFEN
jgi:hypothetical protein